MKKQILLIICILAFTPQHIFSQCSVTIIPQGSTSLCEGDSLVLDAVATGGGQQIDQSSLLYNGGTSARTLPGYSTWQSFTAGITGTLKKIDLGFFNYINGVSTMIIYKGSGTAGTVLDNHQINVVCPAGNCMLSFLVNIPVTSGQKYTVRVIPGAGMPDPYGVQIGSPGPYSSGKFGLVDPSGTDTSNGFDWVFRTWVGGNLSYLWSTGETSQSITVNTGGQYMVTVSDNLGCSASDTVSILPVANPVVHLGNDTTICSGCSLNLNAGAGFSSYNWSTGQTASSITVNVAGTYGVVVSNSYGCTGSDAIAVQLGTVGIDDATKNDHFNIITDHEKENISIIPDKTVAEPYCSSLYDLSGRRIYKKESTGIALINTGAFEKGVYLLRITIHETIINKKLLIR